MLQSTAKRNRVLLISGGLTVISLLFFFLMPIFPLAEKFREATAFRIAMYGYGGEIRSSLIPFGRCMVFLIPVLYMLAAALFLFTKKAGSIVAAVLLALSFSIVLIMVSSLRFPGVEIMVIRSPIAYILRASDYALLHLLFYVGSSFWFFHAKRPLNLEKGNGDK